MKTQVPKDDVTNLNSDVTVNIRFYHLQDKISLRCLASCFSQFLGNVHTQAEDVQLKRQAGKSTFYFQHFSFFCSDGVKLFSSFKAFVTKARKGNTKCANECDLRRYLSMSCPFWAQDMDPATAPNQCCSLQNLPELSKKVSLFKGSRSLALVLY